MVVLGLIDPSNYLGGRVQLHPDLARAALDRVLASRFDWTTEHAAAAVYDLVVTSMANAMHEVSVQKGYDPRDFLFLAYGGTLPLFAWQIAAAVGISDVVIPRGSSVFCASGVLASDYVLRLDQTVSWNLEDADDLERVNQEADRMIAAARSEMEGEGFPADQVRIARSADLKFMGQVYELSLPLPDRPLVPEDGPQLAADFRELYERVYGRGTAWKGVPTMLLTYTVTATGDLPHPSRAAAPEAPADPATITKSTRTVFLPAVREEATIPIYDGTRFTTGTAISGPAIIDETDTTIYVPPGVRARRDAFSNYRLGPDGAA
jgi:N-methylhydantoinase A